MHKINNLGEIGQPCLIPRKILILGHSRVKGDEYHYKHFNNFAEPFSKFFEHCKQKHLLMLSKRMSQSTLLNFDLYKLLQKRKCSSWIHFWSSNMSSSFVLSLLKCYLTGTATAALYKVLVLSVKPFVSHLCNICGNQETKTFSPVSSVVIEWDKCDKEHKSEKRAVHFSSDWLTNKIIYMLINLVCNSSWTLSLIWAVTPNCGSITAATFISKTEIFATGIKLGPEIK